MPCFSPKIAQQSVKGGLVAFSNFVAGAPFLTIPCGQCIGCRTARSQAWAVRCMGEAQTAGQSRSWFVTATYAPEFNPVTLVPRDHTLFLKRVRKHFGPVRFFMCGEYGDESERLASHGFGRPHYHYLLFGLDIPDLVRYSGNGPTSLFTSETLTRLWGKGHVVIGLVEEQSVNYVAGYVLKKRMGKGAAEFHNVFHPETGEPLKMQPVFARMSLKPGIGAEWFSRFYRDVYPADKFPLKGGRFVRPPKYFDVLYERLASSDGSLPSLESLKDKRREAATVHADDATDARLKVRETCAKAKANFYRSRKL